MATKMVKNNNLHRPASSTESLQRFSQCASTSFPSLLSLLAFVEAGSAVFKHRQTFRLNYIFLNQQLNFDVAAILDTRVAILDTRVLYPS